MNGDFKPHFLWDRALFLLVYLRMLSTTKALGLWSKRKYRGLGRRGIVEGLWAEVYRYLTWTCSIVDKIRTPRNMSTDR